MNKNELIEDLMAIVDRNGSRRQKYRRNLRTYYHTFGLGMTNIDDTSVPGYYSSSQYDTEEDTSSGIQENQIKSIIDSLVSNIEDQKVRPFFNTVNGTYREQRIAIQAQQFFDQLFDSQNVNRTVTRAFKDACIFDTGIVYIDKDFMSIEKVMPWQISIDNREASYNCLTRLVWKAENYPVTLLPFTDSKLRKKIENTRQDCTYYRYWNLNERKLVYYIPEFDFYREEDWDDVLPFIFINYDEPVKGFSSNSVVDLLWGMQLEVDSLLVKIKDASQLSTPLKFFVPETSNIKTKQLDNRTGTIITYSALPNQSTAPIVTATEPFMDPQWLSTLQQMKQDMYEIIGVPMQDITGKKQQGLDSGVAIQTMEDIGDQRFSTQLNSVIRTYVDIAKLCISLFNDADSILPYDVTRKKFTWDDLKGAINQLSIQFSAAQSLSKDPEKRSQEVLLLVQMGVIPQNRIATLMELPDVTSGYSLANLSLEASQEVIDNCLINNDFDVPDFVPTDMLMGEIINTCLTLFKANKDANKGDIDKLLQLYKICAMKNNEAQTSAEMAAVGSLNQELQADLANPNGQINSAMNNAIMQPQQPQPISNNNGE
jgi:hypothetical protein